MGVEKMSKEARDLIAQFQAYQQQLETLLVQKEGLKLQALEIDRALDELRTTRQTTAYKITGTVMIKKPVKVLQKELTERRENLSVRLKSIEKAEARTSERLKQLQARLKKVLR
jgi:prefoldin beta subunit